MAARPDWGFRMSLRPRRLGTRMFVLSIGMAALGAFVLAGVLRLRNEGTVRADAAANAAITAQMMSRQVAVDVYFDDPRAAVKPLKTLEAAPQFLAAAVHRADGSVLASWQRPGALPSVLPPPDGPPVERSADGLVLRVPILGYGDGARLGTLVAATELTAVERRLGADALVVLLATLAVIVAAMAVNWPLSRRMAAPLEELASAMKRVTRGDSAALRVASGSDDELAELAAAFNEMAGRVEVRERDLARSRSSLERLLSSIPDTILVLDAGLRLVEVRTREAHLLARPAASSHGAALSELLDAPQGLLLEEEALLALQTGGTRARSVSVSWGGRSRELELQTSRFEQEGEPRALLILRDVTERRRMEQTLQESSRLEAMGRLAGGVAHDLNNHLAVLQASVEMLASELSAGVRAEVVADAKAASGQAAGLVRDLLAFARHRKVELSVIDLNQVLDRIGRLCDRTFDRRIRLVAGARAPQALVQGDAAQLESALLNLVVNARDALPAGGLITISSREVRREQLPAAPGTSNLAGERFIEVTVEDNGTGIPSAVLPHIFEPFFTTKEEGRGTGLGLAAVYGTVKGHGGGISVSSVEGKGTTMRLYLPAQGGAPQPALALGALPPLPHPCAVLLLDDEGLVRASTARLLRMLGCQVALSEASPQAAIDWFARSKEAVDLAVIDLNMPGMHGAEAARRLRELDPLLPIVFISGYDPSGQDLSALGDGYLSKPFTLAALGERLAQAQRGARALAREARLGRDSGPPSLPVAAPLGPVKG